MFLDLGNYKAISKCLERLANKKIKRRISRGLYDKPKYNKKYKHTNNKAIGNFSYKTLIVIQALKAIGVDNLTTKDIEIIRKNLTFKEKETLLKEGIKTNIWIYEVIKKICRW